MAVSRRNFLHHGVIVATAFAAKPLLALGTKRPMGGDDQTRELPGRPSSGSDNWQDHAGALEGLGRAKFAAAIGTSFGVLLADANLPVWVTLTGVNDLPAIASVNPASLAVAARQSAPAPATSGFLLLFSGSTPLPQGTYLFEHGELGRFALFTVPEGNGQEIYTAVVNRLDAPTVIAVPYANGQSAGSGTAPVIVPNGATVAPATSSGTENLPADFSGTPAVRRAAVRD